MMRILVTGAAGFIGFHLAKRFLDRGDLVVGIDNLNDYYDVSLKKARLAQLEPYDNFTFLKIDIADRDAMEKLFKNHEFDRVVHMAAQAGVRYSLKNPHAYVQSNLVGFLNVLECCRRQWSGNEEAEKQRSTEAEKGLGGEVISASLPLCFSASKHLVFASSSSVYGLNTKMPFSVRDNVDHPISLYAATKKGGELMAHAYSHLYGIPTTGLRFFTVYGPWGRPDMALFKFTRAILEGSPIDVYNEGKMRRDFTYIDDIVEGVVRVTDSIPSPLVGEACPERSRRGQGEGNPIDSRFTIHNSRTLDPGTSTCAPYRIYNIGNHSPIELMDFIRALEHALGKKAKMTLLPMQPGDVPATYADVDDLMRDVGFAPKTLIQDGIRKFIDWYISYYS
jgi:UDP-glucuronate 4-epimerase